MTTKRCSQCGEEKDVTLFHPDSRMSSGRASRCRECCRAIWRQSKYGGVAHQFKRCLRCGEEKRISCFYLTEKTDDGRSNRCQDCHRAEQAGQRTGKPLPSLRPRGPRSRKRAQPQPVAIQTARAIHAIHVRIPLPARGALAFQLLNPPFQRGMR